MSNIKKYQPLFIPGAIIIAGIVVALAVILTLGGNSGEKTTKNGENLLVTIAKEVGLNKNDFAACMDEGDVENIQADFQDGVAAGAQGTPYSVAIFADGTTYPINGAQTVEGVRSILEGNRPFIEDDQSTNVAPVTEDDHIRGSLDAKIKIVEYSDLDCPFCSQFHETMKTVIEEYDGEVAWIYRHFPITNLHPNAVVKAVATECAAQLEGNDAFWEYADLLFESQGEI